MITLVAMSPCGLCGYVRQGFAVSTVRINKRSMRSYGSNLSMFPEKCMECGWVSPWPPRFAVRAAADDAAKINAYRLRKWPELAGERAG